MVPERQRDCRKKVSSSSHNEDRELLEDVVKDLLYLTIDIGAPHIEDMPQWTWRHVAGLGEQFGLLLRKVARVVVYYHDSRAPRD